MTTLAKMASRSRKDYKSIGNIQLLFLTAGSTDILHSNSYCWALNRRTNIVKTKKQLQDVLPKMLCSCTKNWKTISNVNAAQDTAGLNLLDELISLEQKTKALNGKNIPAKTMLARTQTLRKNIERIIALRDKASLSAEEETILNSAIEALKKDIEQAENKNLSLGEIPQEVEELVKNKLKAKDLELDETPILVAYTLAESGTTRVLSLLMETCALSTKPLVLKVPAYVASWLLLYKQHYYGDVYIVLLDKKDTAEILQTAANMWKPNENGPFKSMVSALKAARLLASV